MFAGDGVASKRHRLGTELEHFLGESIMLPLRAILKNEPGSCEHKDFARPFHFVHRARDCSLVLPFFLLLLAVVSSAGLFRRAFSSRGVEP
jgi:hypothetical protein